MSRSRRSTKTEIEARQKPSVAANLVKRGYTWPSEGMMIDEAEYSRACADPINIAN